MYFYRRFIFRICIVLITIPILIITIYSALSTLTSYSSERVSNYAHLSLPSAIRRPIPDIFDISLWRYILIGRRGNQTRCKVPDPYLAIAIAYCRAQIGEECSMLPCTLVNITNEFTENVTCLRGGKVAIGVKPDWICRKSPALELFSNPHRKPSILAEAYTRLTSELYGQALAPYRDEETSKWGLTLEGESIGYYPSIANVRRVAPLFDITLGYDRQLFDLITDVHLTDYVDQIINNKNQRLTIEQVFEDKVRDRAPIFWMNYNCDTPSNRTGYMLELMRYIRVDVYGKCGNPNWDSNKSISNDPKVLAQEKLALVRQYLFTIAIENSFEHDYVTEKLWQPLAAGSVPIYLGAPNIDNWLPCYNYSCIINLRQFSSIRDAANFINKIAQSRSRYVKYHEWRNEENVRPSFIKMVNYFKEANKHSMECLLCDMVYRHDRGAMRRKLLAANNPFNDPFPSLV